MDAEAVRAEMMRRGEFYLKAFHAEYQTSPTGPRTEYWRGHLSCWRLTISLFYGESAADAMVEEASRTTGLSIPHCGPLTEDGQGYLGWDSGCHTFIGSLGNGPWPQPRGPLNEV